MKIFRSTLTVSFQLYDVFEDLRRKVKDMDRVISDVCRVTDRPQGPGVVPGSRCPSRTFRQGPNLSPR